MHEKAAVWQAQQVSCEKHYKQSHCSEPKTNKKVQRAVQLYVNIYSTVQFCKIQLAMLLIYQTNTKYVTTSKHELPHDIENTISKASAVLRTKLNARLVIQCPVIFWPGRVSVFMHKRYFRLCNSNNHDKGMINTNFLLAEPKLLRSIETCLLCFVKSSDL